MTERTRWRIEDEPDLVRRDGCLLALVFCCAAWALAIVVGALWMGWL